MDEGTVVFGPLIGIFDHQLNGRARGCQQSAFAIDDPRQHTCDVRLPALGRVTRLSRPPLVEIGLNVAFKVKRQAGRTTVDHHADRRTVAFTPGRDAKHVAERVERHGVSILLPASEWCRESPIV